MSHGNPVNMVIIIMTGSIWFGVEMTGHYINKRLVMFASPKGE